VSLCYRCLSFVPMPFFRLSSAAPPIEQSRQRVRVLRRRWTRSATDSGIRRVRRRREDPRAGFSKIRTSDSRSKMRRTVSSLKFHCSASSAGKKCRSNRREHGASPGRRTAPSFAAVAMSFIESTARFARSPCT